MGWAWAAVSSSPSSSVCSLSPLPSPVLASGPPATDARMTQPRERDWGPPFIPRPPIHLPIHPPNPPPPTHLPTPIHPPTSPSNQPDHLQPIHSPTYLPTHLLTYNSSSHPFIHLHPPTHHPFIHLHPPTHPPTHSSTFHPTIHPSTHSCILQKRVHLSTHHDTSRQNHLLAFQRPIQASVRLGLNPRRKRLLCISFVRDHANGHLSSIQGLLLG